MIPVILNVIVLVFAIFSACGGNMRPPDTIPVEMRGTWTGEARVVIGNDAPRTYPLDVLISDDGQVGHVVGPCPVGDQSVDVFGFDAHLINRGEVTCAFPTFVDGCLQTFVYQQVDVTLTDGILEIRATGRSEHARLSVQCMEVLPLMFTFSGSKAPTGDRPSGEPL